MKRVQEFLGPEGEIANMVISGLHDAMPELKRAPTPRSWKSSSLCFSRRRPISSMR